MNIKDIAKQAGVSTASVSYVINGRNKVGEATREKVLNIIKKSGYEVSGAARELKLKTTKTIGIFMDIISGPYFSEIVQGIETVIQNKGYDFLIAPNYHSTQEGILPRILLEKRVDGAIIFSLNMSEKNIETLSNLNIPIVMLDREIYKKNICSVLVESKIGIAETVSHLIENKISKIAFLSGISYHYDNIQRAEAFKETLQQNNISIPEEWFFAGNFNEDSGIKTASIISKMKNRPQAVICANDQMAIGLIHGLRKKGIRIPQDISVIGFDDITFARFTTPALTTVRTPKFNIGKTAAETLFRGINGDDIQGVIKLPSSLIIRDSTLKNLQRRMAMRRFRAISNV